MTSRDNLLRRVTIANPVPADSDLPDELADSRPPVVLLIDESNSPIARPKVSVTRKWRGPAIAAAAAIIVAVAISVPLLLGGGQDGTTTADIALTTIPVVATTTRHPPATTLPPTTVPVVPTTALPPAPDLMQRVGADVMQPVVGLFAMTEFGSGLVAVGFDPGEEDLRQNGVIFMSDDGVTWTRLAENDPALTLGGVLIYGITEGGPGLVAVGMGCEDDTAPCLSHPTVWTSVDGTEWTRSGADPDVFGEGGAMLDVMVTDHGIIAVGSTMEVGSDETFLSRSAVWFSPDGADWSRVWDGDPFDTEESRFIPGIMAVTADPAGLIVGVGTAENDLGEFVGAAWVSTDGQSWERVEPNSSEFGSDTGADVTVFDVTWSSAGFIAVGTEDGTEVAIWQSTDGRSWNRVETTEETFGRMGTLSSVATLESGFVATGPHGFANRGERPVTLWTSPDGSTWNRVHVIGAGYAMSVVATDDTITVAGGMPGDFNFHAAVWAGPVFDPGAPPSDPLPATDPQPPEVDEEASTGLTPIGTLEAGRSCEQLAAASYSYAEAVSYWVRYDRSTDLDPDGNGLPCEDDYSAVDIAEVYGGPDSMSVHIVSALPGDSEGRIFENTGPAVDAGVICPTGTTEFLNNNPPTRSGALYRWEDRFTCGDGSGTFILGTDVFIFVESGGTEYGIWNIVSGTGAYESLTGGGGGRTGPGDADAWADDLVGRLASGTEEN